MNDLYTQYGQLMIQQEILQNQINQVKQLISEELQKQPEDTASDKKTK